jgi:ribosomal-protein-alanine N-acetyltransferase
MVRIEPIPSEELGEATALEKASGLSTGGEERFYRLQASPQFILLGAYLHEDTTRRLIGLIYGMVVIDEFQIDNLAVDENFRRNGVGSALLDAALERAKGLGADQAILEVRDSNLRAQRLYLKCGFATLSRRTAYYSDPVEDALILGWRADGRQWILDTKNASRDRK